MEHSVNADSLCGQTLIWWRSNNELIVGFVKLLPFALTILEFLEYATVFEELLAKVGIGIGSVVPPLIDVKVVAHESVSVSTTATVSIREQPSSG